MGQHQSLQPTEAPAAIRRAENKFSVEELRLLKSVFKDLIERSNGEGVNKETFLRFIPYPGLFGGLPPLSLHSLRDMGSTQKGATAPS